MKEEQRSEYEICLHIKGPCIESGPGCDRVIVAHAILRLFKGKGSISSHLHDKKNNEEAPNLATAIEQVANKSIPAVVHVEVIERQSITNPFYGLENNPLFRFFGLPKGPKIQRELFGLGSGMIMDSDGHILTNNHVVAGANKIEVVMAEGRTFSGDSVKVVGTDSKTDLAVLQIEEKSEFPFVTMEDSDKIEVGQWVVAIGQPRGLSQTVTQGIISAVHRRGLVEPGSYQDFIQTDAAINPGNSGGPLLNLRAEVIGINSAIMSESGGFEGIGFAIPSNMAVYVAKQLIAHGKVERGWLGITIQSFTPELAKSFGLTSTKGALVADITKGGPADKAGIKKGDVVVEYQGKEVPDADTLRNLVAVTPAGQNADVTLVRNGQKESMTVQVGNLEEENKKLAATLKERLGVVVRTMTASDIETYGLENQVGVIITEVDPGGPAAEVGLEAGDAIIEINNQPVDSSEALAAAVQAMEQGKRAELFVLDHRSGQTGSVAVVLR